MVAAVVAAVIADTAAVVITRSSVTVDMSIAPLPPATVPRKPEVARSVGLPADAPDRTPHRCRASNSYVAGVVMILLLGSTAIAGYSLGHFMAGAADGGGAGHQLASAAVWGQAAGDQSLTSYFVADYVSDDESNCYKKLREYDTGVCNGQNPRPSSECPVKSGFFSDSKCQDTLDDLCARPTALRTRGRFENYAVIAW